MGAGMPGGLDQEKQDQMQKVVTDVSGLFVKNFAIAFAIEIAISAKEELNPPTDWTSDLKLLPLDADKTLSKDLMEGKVTKRGGKITNWKERYMVLHGDDDNYKLEYFDGKPETGKKPKGSIELAGYRVRQVPEEGLTLSKSALFEQVFIRAQLKEGQYGLKLDPWSYGRRVYYFIFDSVEEGKKWKRALEDGCWYARNPKDENPVVAKAFDRCLNMVRDEYEHWISISYYSDEASRLGQFMCAAIYDRVLRDVIDQLPDTGRETAESTIVSIMQGMVKGAASGAYNGARAAAIKLQPILTEKMKPLIEPYVTQENQLKAKIAEKVGATITPVVQPLTDKFLAPMAAKITSKCVEGCIKMIAGFSKYIDEHSSKPDWLNEMVCYSTYWYWSPANDAFDVAWDAWSYYSDNPAQLVPGATSSGMYNILIDRYRHIAKRAAITFKKKYEGNVSHKSEFLAELKADLITMTQVTLIDIFMDALGSTIVEQIKKPGMKLLGPVEDAIKAIPVPGLDEFLNVESMLDDVLTGSMTELFKGIVAKPLEAGLAELSGVSV